MANAELLKSELKTITKALNNELKIEILNMLYESEDGCTEHQILASIDEEGIKIKEVLKELEAISFIKRRTANLHPLEWENIYFLSDKGLRIYSLLRALAEREVVLWESFKKVWG